MESGFSLNSLASDWGAKLFNGGVQGALATGQAVATSELDALIRRQTAQLPTSPIAAVPTSQPRPTPEAVAAAAAAPGIPKEAMIIGGLLVGVVLIVALTR